MPNVVDITVFSLLLLWLLVPISLLLMAGISARASTSESLQRAWKISRWLTASALAASLAVGVLLLLDAQGVPTGLPEAAQPLGLYPDGLAVWMALLISLLGTVLLRFAENYLKGDRGERRFLPWCLVVLASVMLLVFTHHLVVMLIAWVGISVALHHLLTLYPERVEAQRAAWQKFIVSRLGDAALIVAVALLYARFGTFQLPELFAAAALTPGGWQVEAASVALAIAALCKCAQVPMHGWLIKVMEAPTPVSALLHAGVINLGGFVWLRLFPVFDGLTLGHYLLIVIGGFTALVAVMTMLTQASVKHALAWSTCAQMGFMLFEIGVGAYTLALAHLLAHSLYKAHSFLASGRTVRASRCVRLPLASLRQRLSLALPAAALAAGVLVVWPALVSHNPLLGALLSLAVGSTLLGMPLGTAKLNRLGMFVMALALVPLYALLHSLLAPALPSAYTPLTFSAGLLGGMVLVSMVLVAGLVTLFPQAAWVARWRVHFSQGLYLALPFQRVVDAVAPIRAWRRASSPAPDLKGEWS
ncbi:NADH-quinone oxidoreductase subunit L [Halomonas qinghailakensis]|uniref:Probable inorganic carbon transporter subunit DabB n=1 Tax=Halomonas qinghailakensis TaxID=2937790 RepID=A0AA46TQ32_9GAMM|nr:MULTISPECIES: NADH-quinone oxidoreductase subunit L [Halomonas]UYO74475.1 NADH-quinone oxidoreductase subunit L [Halomonas sp. ZZQ-149]